MCPKGKPCLGHDGVEISFYLDGEPKLALMAAQINVITPVIPSQPALLDMLSCGDRTAN